MGLRHAYLIMAHNNFEVLETLIKLIDHPNNDIYLHIDVKSSYSIDKLYIELKYSKVYEIPRMSVWWADYTQVECEMNLFSIASKGNYDYYHMMSGSDLPLKNQTEIQNFFIEHNGKEFVQFYGGPLEDYFHTFVSRYHLFQKPLACVSNKGLKLIFTFLNKLCLLIQKICRVNRLKHDKNFLKKGCNWVSVTHDFVLYLLSQNDYIESRFKGCKSPDEFFLQTVLFNSSFRNNLFRSEMIDDYYGCLRYIDWKRGNPYIYRITDFDELINSGYLFARKFSFEKDSEITMKLYSYLKGN
nr:beta-1,6-N-acetylglucosaminyltransferase [Lysinibacillus timonensis]